MAYPKNSPSLLNFNHRFEWNLEIMKIALVVGYFFIK